MIFVTLLLAVELLQRTASAPPQKTIENIKRLQSQLQENEDQIRRLQSRIQSSTNPANELAALDAPTLRRKIDRRRQQNKTLATQIRKLRRDKSLAIRRKAVAQSREAQTRPDEERKLKDLKKSISETQARLKKFGKGKRVVYNVAKGSWKERWIVQISGQRILAAPLGRTERPREFASASAFETWAGRRGVSSFYFLLIVQPDGIRQFETIRKTLKNSGASIGFDLIGSDQSAIDPKTGAGGR